MLDQMGVPGSGHSLICAPGAEEQASPEWSGNIGPNGGYVIYFGPVEFCHLIDSRLAELYYLFIIGHKSQVIKSLRP
jgi:hypothetical protein